MKLTAQDYNNSIYISKLKSLEFGTAILRWLSDYLTCRSQYVVVNGAEYQLTPVLSGVPQGSIYTRSFTFPNLYKQFINHSIFKFNKNPSLCRLRALLYHTIDSPEAFYNVQNDINDVAKWSDMNHLTLNKEKCKLANANFKKDILFKSTCGHI